MKIIYNTEIMKRILHISIILAALALAMKASAAVDYIHDDGIPNVNVGVGGGGGDMIVLNRFAAQAGGEGIEQISVNWTGIASNYPATVLVYQDPNSDGDLSDLILLTEMNVLTQSTGTTGINSRTFATYIIPQTYVSGDFYIGAYVQNMSGADHPFSYDTDTPASNTSYFFENTSAADMFLGNPGASSTLQGWTENFVTPGNFMIRANGVGALPPVPEPSTVLLATMGLLLFRRRHAKN